MRTTIRTARFDGYAWQDMRTWRTVAFEAYQSNKEGELGVYAEDEIWHGQELLLANREYPMEEEATAREKMPEITEDGTENEEVLGT